MAYIRGPGQRCGDQGGTQLKGPFITRVPLARLRFEDLAHPQPQLLEIPNGQFPAAHARPPNPATALDGKICYQNTWVRPLWSALINVKVSFRGHLQMYRPFLGVFI